MPSPTSATLDAVGPRLRHLPHRVVTRHAGSVRLSARRNVSTNTPLTKPRLFPELLEEIVEILGEEVVIDEESCAEDLVGLLGETRAQRCLNRVIPLVSKGLARLAFAIRRRHINIRSSDHLLHFRARLQTGGPWNTTTQLYVTVDTSTNFGDLAAVLDKLCALRRFGVQHVSRSTIANYGAHTVRPRRFLPIKVVEAIGKLTMLEVLVFGAGETYVSVEDLQALGRALPRVEFLHIPRRLVHRSSVGDVEEVVPMNFPALRTLSVGSAGERGACTALEDFMRSAVVPRLTRFNVVGSVPVGCRALLSCIETVRCIETTVSSWEIWDNTGGVEHLVLHMDSVASPVLSDWGHLRTVTAVCAMRQRGIDNWQICVGALWRAVLAVIREGDLTFPSGDAHQDSLGLAVSAQSHRGISGFFSQHGHWVNVRLRTRVILY